jgi:sRNA-binding protein
VAAVETDIVGQPTGEVASQPADSPAVKTLSSRKAPEQRQRREHPAMPPREPRDVMGGQELLK